MEKKGQKQGGHTLTQAHSEDHRNAQSMAQLMEHRTIVQEVVGSNIGRTITQGP